MQKHEMEDQFVIRNSKWFHQFAIMSPALRFAITMTYCIDENNQKFSVNAAELVVGSKRCETGTVFGGGMARKVEMEVW